jgi:hypothetical protein
MDEVSSAEIGYGVIIDLFSTEASAGAGKALKR